MASTVRREAVAGVLGWTEPEALVSYHLDL